MAWSARIILGTAAALAAGSALACERQAPCGADRYGPSHHRYDAYVEPYGWRGAPPPCRSACDGGEITLPSSFFAGAGGVGPIPSGPIYGGGYYYVRGGGFAGARAYASGSASAVVSTRVSVHVSGGGRSGGCCH